MKMLGYKQFTQPPSDFYKLLMWGAKAILVLAGIVLIAAIFTLFNNLSYSEYTIEKETCKNISDMTRQEYIDWGKGADYAYCKHVCIYSAAHYSPVFKDDPEKFDLEGCMNVCEQLICTKETVEFIEKEVTNTEYIDKCCVQIENRFVCIKLKDNTKISGLNINNVSKDFSECVNIPIKKIVTISKEEITKEFLENNCILCCNDFCFNNENERYAVSEYTNCIKSKDKEWHCQFGENKYFINYN